MFAFLSLIADLVDQKTITERIKVAMALTVIAGLSVACSSDGDKTLSSIEWTACVDQPAIECGKLEVPLDYQNTEGDVIELALARLPSTGDARLGHLVMNPGGPGDSGIGLIRNLTATSLPDDIRNNFHLLSFDPRGIGESGAPVCGADLAEAYDGYPIGTKGLDELLQAGQQMTDLCFEEYGDYLQLLGSTNVVRDVDEIRKAIGDKQLNFLGYSYGTRLASIYLELFPDNVGRLVLDAANPPDPDMVELMRDRVVEMQKIFMDWLGGCTTFDAGCDPAQIARSLSSRVNALLVEADTPDSAAAQDEVSLLSSLILLNIEQPLLNEFTIRRFVKYAASYDIDELTQLIQELNTLTGGNISTVLNGDDEGQDFAGVRAVICADDTRRPTMNELLALSVEFNEISDLFAETVLPLAAVCNGWPQSIDPVPVLTQPSSGRTLIIGGVADYETPLLWAQQLATATGATLIVSDHPGHTVALTGNSQCVDDTVTEFLIGSDSIESGNCFVDTQLIQ